MKTIFIIFGIILRIVIYAALPVLAFILITSRTSALGGIQSFVILTGSMAPALPVGTVVMTKQMPTYSKNDVIAFKKDDKNVTHRIVEVENKNNVFSYKTRGDANNVADIDLVRKDNVLGKMIFSIPYLGTFILFLKTVPGFLIFIVLPAIIYIFFEIFNIKHEMTKEIKKKLLQNMQPKT